MHTPGSGPTARRITVEVCADSAAGVRAALSGGADRVELCAGLEVGGLTPSAALQQRAAEILPIHVLIRPRPGDFCYDRDERAVMERDIELAGGSAAAVVVGALTPAGDVDLPAMRGFLRAADGTPVTFHRAFDMARDPLAALNDLLELGISILLTSGGRRSAADGADAIAELVQRAGPGLTVMPGGGITAANAAEIARRTQARAFHFSARHSVGSPMRYRNPNVSMGTAGQDEYSRLTTSADLVRQIVDALTGAAPTTAT